MDFLILIHSFPSSGGLILEGWVIPPKMGLGGRVVLQGGLLLVATAWIYAAGADAGTTGTQEVSG